MLATIKEKAEVLPGGIIQLHTKNLPANTIVSVSAVLEFSNLPRKEGNPIKETAGILKNRFKNPVKTQQELRSEWDNRL